MLIDFTNDEITVLRAILRTTEQQTNEIIKEIEATGHVVWPETHAILAACASILNKTGGP